MNFAEKDLTPWFPGDIKPKRVGVYQRNYREEIPGDFGVPHVHSISYEKMGQ